MAHEVDNSTFNRFQQAKEDIRQDLYHHKKAVIGTVAGLVVAAIIISSWVTQYVSLLFGNRKHISIVELFTAWASNIVSVIFTIILVIALCKGAYKFRKWTAKDYTQDYDGNYKISNSGEYGTAHWQTEKERHECFNMEKDINKITDDILGMDKRGRIYSLRNDLMSINKNKIVFGSAGSGKTAAIINNDIMQCIRRGESMIITDSKGDVYRETSSIARKHGYLVRVLNLKPEELKNSDAWDPIKYITIEDEIQADVLANAIIENTENGPLEFWGNNEMGALKATILLVATTPDYEGNRNFGEVANIISHPQSFDSKFYGLPDDHPAKTAFDIYAVAKDEVKRQILNGLGIRIRLLNNKYVKHIVSHDEIDLTLPMRRKCMYYIIISDTDTTMKFVASMFFTQVFMVQISYSDSLTKEMKKKQKTVRYELDEFANIGKIPYFDNKISTFRSRKINSTIILQNTAQLELMYPDKAHVAIISNSSTQILLKAGDLETAQHFSDICGQTTTKVENGRYQKARSQTLDMHDSEYMTEGSGQRMILMSDEAIRMDYNTMVVCVSGFPPVKLQKYICEMHHPMYKESVETPPNRHKPKWRKELEEKNRETEQRMEKLKEKSLARKMDIKGEQPDAVSHTPAAGERQHSPAARPAGQKAVSQSAPKHRPAHSAQGAMPAKEPKEEKPIYAPKQEPKQEPKPEPKPAAPPTQAPAVESNKPAEPARTASRKSAMTNKPVYTAEELQIREAIAAEKEAKKKGGRLALTMESATKGDDLFDDML